MMVTKFASPEEAMTSYQDIKRSTEIREVKRQDCRLKFSDKGAASIQIGDEDLNLNMAALNQYLIRTCGKAAPKAFGLFSSVRGDEHDNWFKQGINLVNKITETSKGELRLHVVKNEILGVTSLKHVKLYDADLLELVQKSVASFTGFRSSWSPNMTVFDYDLEKFKDPTGLEWNFTLRFENNEFGRNAFQVSTLGVRQICTNGAIITLDEVKAHRIIHVRHLTVALISDLIDRSLKNLEDVSKVIRKSFGTVIKDYTVIWRMLRKKFQVRKDDRPKITAFIDEEDRPDTTYAFGNGLSAYANTFSNIDRYYALQEAAGVLYAYNK